MPPEDFDLMRLWDPGRPGFGTKDEPRLLGGLDIVVQIRATYSHGSK